MQTTSADNHSKPHREVAVRNLGYTDGPDLNQQSNIKRRIAFLGAWDFDGPSDPRYAFGDGKDTRFDPGNQPSAYAALPEIEQDALQVWIGLTMRPTKTTGPGTSYSAKHDFEQVGFHVSNGVFKGAMIVAGYHPVDRDALNWEFRVRPTNRPRRTGHGRRTGTVNVLYYDLPEDAEGRERLATLVERVKGRVA